MINSILDTDLYKLTMQQAVLELYPNAQVESEFINRRLTNVFTPEFVEALQQEVANLCQLKLHQAERIFLEQACPYFKPAYLDYLSNYRFNSKELTMTLNQGHLKINIKGPWHRTILWEVPLMALISELYFKIVDKNWTVPKDYLLPGKADMLKNVQFSDFGTRRRRDFSTQKRVVEYFADKLPGHFVGTSNVHLAQLFNVSPIGTMAHEWIMGVSALEGLRHANRFALHNWAKVYKGQLGIALTDTFGSDAFFRDFDKELASLYDGTRHDSNCPFVFTDKQIAHYLSLSINPLSKKILFSDGLTCPDVLRIEKHCKPYIKAGFGIGTHLTNDYPGSPALNMVIKLTKCNGIDLVKLSDVDSKAIGTKDALRVARYVFFNKPLDEQ